MIEKVDQLQRNMSRFKEMLSSDEEESPETNHLRSSVGLRSPSLVRPILATRRRRRSLKKKRKSRPTVPQLNTVDQIDLTIDEVEIERLAGES